MTSHSCATNITADGTVGMRRGVSSSHCHTGGSSCGCRKKIAKLRAALMGILGANTPEELVQLKVGIQLVPVSEDERDNALRAIEVLQEVETPYS